MSVTVIPIVDARNWKTEEESMSSRPQHCKDWLEYLEES